ncbi:hypothetical protein DVB87_22495 [Tsukamurella tyrosinosolvens]|nr:hypothetical protein DVB87_22495 [Tsukamurella tyrosinosolvens]
MPRSTRRKDVVMHIARTALISTGSAALLAAAVAPTAGADVGPVCANNPTGVVAYASNAVRQQPPAPPAVIPGEMVVSAIPTPWKDTDWNASLRWRNVDTGAQGSVSKAPLSTGVALFDRVPTQRGTVVFTVRTNRIGIDPPTLECHGVARIS